jgi:outer membrane protein assembly factor BamB
MLKLARVGTVALVALAFVPLHASSPKFFQAATQVDFLKGDVENLSIDSHGQLTLGPATELVYETSAPFLWSLLAQPDGTLFIGTGNEGKVFRVDPQGTGSLFFDSTELEVHALAPAPNGGVYVGTSPDGKIYKVDRDGKSSPLFSVDDKYIWALAVDARGDVFAGTGDKGIIYRITPDGKGTTFYKTTASHATALAFDKSGHLLVGTGTPGKVMRIDPDGKAFVLLDSPFQEIRSLRFDDTGNLYVAALSARGGTTGSSPTSTDTSVERTGAEAVRAPVPSVSAEITSISIVDVGSAGSAGSPREDRRAPKGAVYRIKPDGAWDQLWESRDDSPYDLTFDQSGALIIGTGNKGKLYRLDGEPPRPTLLARASGQQVTAFHRDSRGRLYYATANPGKLFRLSPDRAARGTYESETRDAQMVSTWGALSWRATVPSGGGVELFTRSGNTETPDDTWSAWSAAYTNGDGSPITSPKARYLQWRAVITGKGEGPVLTSVTAAYLQRNLRPQVRSITIHPPGIVFQKPFSTGEPDLAGFDDQTTPERKLAQAAAQQSTPVSQALGRRTYQKGLQTLAWKADDENDDDLVYDVLYRREGETTWKTLRKAMSETILVWDTTTVANGTYFVKIVASDAPSNPLGTALTGELDSSTFEIDNTPPLIVVNTARVDRGRTIITFDVKDDHSPIQRVEFSQDGQRWRGVFPLDGIADSREEHYQLTVEGELGERGLTLRASDTMNNTATAHVDAPRPR